MKVDYDKTYSPCLQREMEIKVYGHGGRPMLVFPAQDGRFFDFEGFGMIEAIKDFIEQGLVQVFCVDSIDRESWSFKEGDPYHRIYMHEQWFHYVVDELVPKIYAWQKRRCGVITTGCSMGATHALNFMLRRPDLFNATICLSGYYDADLFFGDFQHPLIYQNSPIQYIEGMAYDHPYVEMYRQSDIILCCGQGAWEDEMIYATKRMQTLFAYKDIPAWIDFWGYDVNHDWPWWKKQLPYFLKQLI